MRSRIVLIIGAVLGLMLVAPGGGASLSAQDVDFSTHTYLGAGYAVNAPRMMIGFSGFGLSPNLPVGVFADFKFRRDEPGGDEFLVRGRTADEAIADGHFPFRVEQIWMSGAAGLIRRVSDDVAIYAGAGVSRRRVYHEFEDPEREWGDDGFYWIEHEPDWGTFASALGGVFIHAGRNLVFRFGGESAPMGATVGVYLSLPR